MQKFISLVVSSFVVLGTSSFAEEERPLKPPLGEGGEERERPPRGERPSRGERSGGGGPRPTDLGESDAELGSAGIAWYPILEDGLAEAKRSNKPIFFMAVASQCGGISGVF